MPFLRDVIVRIFFHSTLAPVVVHILESMRSQIPLSALLFPILLSLFLSLTSAVGASPSSGLADRKCLSVKQLLSAEPLVSGAVALS
jgi:hypothetical protein